MIVRNFRKRINHLRVSLRLSKARMPLTMCFNSGSELLGESTNPRSSRVQTSSTPNLFKCTRSELQRDKSESKEKHESVF